MQGSAGGSGADPPARLRILVLIKGLGLGGAERLVAGLLAHRDSASFEYEAAFVLAGQDALAPALRRAGVPVHPLGARASWDLRWLGALRRLLRDGRFDVVHSHLPYAASFARVVTRSLPAGRRPVLVYTEHSLWDRAALLTRALNRSTVGMDRALFVVSPAARAALPARLRDHAEVVVHGVDRSASAAVLARRDERRAEVRAELGVHDDEVLALTVANFRAEKGHDVLVAAARRTAEAGSPVRFALVGAGPLEGAVRAAVAEAGLGDRVLLLGRRDDTLRLMAGSDLFVLPSSQEGMPVALMEAMSVGLPVVATRVGGVPDIVTDGVEGILVEVGSAGSLADAVSRLADDPALREAMGRAALARAGSFDIAATAARLEARYRELVGDLVRSR